MLGCVHTCARCRRVHVQLLGHCALNKYKESSSQCHACAHHMHPGGRQSTSRVLLQLLERLRVENVRHWILTCSGFAFLVLPLPLASS